MKKILLTAAFSCFALFSSALDVISASSYLEVDLTEINGKVYGRTEAIRIESGIQFKPITIYLNYDAEGASYNIVTPYDPRKWAQKKINKFAEKIANYLEEQDLYEYFTTDEKKLKELFTKIEL